MRVLHISNIVSHHQLPLARVLSQLVGAGDFRFGATQAPDLERLRMGWDQGESEPWILRPAEVPAHVAEFERWALEADVMLTGERIWDLCRRRVEAGKLTFYFTERWWKPPIGRARLLHPRFLAMALEFRRLLRSPVFHVLPIGTLSAADMYRVFRPARQRMWAYFTAVPEPLPPFARPHDAFVVLWAGRMLPLKRLDVLIDAFARCSREASRPTKLILMGDGPAKAKLQSLARAHGLQHRVEFVPTGPVADVRRLMRVANAFVLCSNAYEGWGAVLNEAMAEGCAVVSSDVTGAGKTMIRHGENGMLFRDGDADELAPILKRLHDDPEKAEAIAEAGQRTIRELWSPQVAGERFIRLCEGLLGGGSLPEYEAGPMALATIG